MTRIKIYIPNNKVVEEIAEYCKSEQSMYFKDFLSEKFNRKMYVDIDDKLSPASFYAMFHKDSTAVQFKLTYL